jgi:membrane-associated phospholipid phosphatase
VIVSCAIDFAGMTSTSSANSHAPVVQPLATTRTAWTRWLIVTVVLVVVAHLLDRTAWQFVRIPSVNDKDWGRLLRSVGYLPTWGAVALGYWLHQRDQPLRGKFTALLILAPTLGGVVAELLKLTVRRLRPDPEQFAYAFRAFSDGPWSNRGMGMPSSHVLVAFAAAAALARLFPRARPLWYALAAGCAFTRVAAGAHFLSDVTVAACLAWAVVALLAARLARD